MISWIFSLLSFQFFPGSPSQEVLDFGTMGMGEKRDIYFAILNKNPIAVTLRGWGANLTGSLVEVIGKTFFQFKKLPLDGDCLIDS